MADASAPASPEALSANFVWALSFSQASMVPMTVTVTLSPTVTNFPAGMRRVTPSPTVTSCVILTSFPVTVTVSPETASASALYRLVYLEEAPSVVMTSLTMLLLLFPVLSTANTSVP